MLIRIERALFGYPGRPVVQVDALDLRPGCCLGVFGPNGSGKTTLVRGLSGLLAPLSGRVVRRDELRIGYLPQHRAMELHWPMSGADAASLAMSSRRPLGWLGSRRRDVERWMRRLEVADLAPRRFALLSGGQQQRLLLAGALSAEPELLILDEPTDGLDVRSQHILMETLRAAAESGLSTLLISHDVEEVTSVCADVLLLHPAADERRAGAAELVPATALADRVAAAHGSLDRGSPR